MFVCRSSGEEFRNQLRRSENSRFLFVQTTLGTCLSEHLSVSLTCLTVSWLSNICLLSVCRWVREFLNEENRGLDVLVEYLSFAQYAVTWVKTGLPLCFLSFGLNFELHMSDLFMVRSHRQMKCSVQVISLEQVWDLQTFYKLFVLRFDGEQSEAGGEVSSIDSPWSRSIEDLHGDCSLPSPSSSVPRAARHSIR